MEPVVQKSVNKDPGNIGLMAAIAAFVIWGIFPVYFKLTQSASALEILAHRIVWSVVFGAVVIQFRKQWPDVKRAITNTKTLMFLMLATLCIATNWGWYIWSVQNDQIFIFIGFPKDLLNKLARNFSKPLAKKG